MKRDCKGGEKEKTKPCETFDFAGISMRGNSEGEEQGKENVANKSSRLMMIIYMAVCIKFCIRETKMTEGNT